jgi:hypothetical protein
LIHRDCALLSSPAQFEPALGTEQLGESELRDSARLARDSLSLFPMQVDVSCSPCICLVLIRLLQKAAFHLARYSPAANVLCSCFTPRFFRLITYLPKLALRGAEAFELLCFSCGLDGGDTSASISGCVDALFYIAIALQAAHLPQLSACPGVDAALSVESNAVVLLWWANMRALAGWRL